MILGEKLRLIMFVSKVLKSNGKVHVVNSMSNLHVPIKDSFSFIEKVFDGKARSLAVILIDLYFETFFALKFIFE